MREGRGQFYPHQHISLLTAIPDFLDLLLCPSNLQVSGSLITQLERQLQETQHALQDTRRALQAVEAESGVRGELCQSLAAEREGGQQRLLEAQAAHREEQAQAASQRQQVERAPMGRLAWPGQVLRPFSPAPPSPATPPRKSAAEMHGHDIASQVQDRDKLLDQLWGSVMALHGTMLAAGAKTGLATSR